MKRVYLSLPSALVPGEPIYTVELSSKKDDKFDIQTEADRVCLGLEGDRRKGHVRGTDLFVGYAPTVDLTLFGIGPVTTSVRKSMGQTPPTL